MHTSPSFARLFLFVGLLLFSGFTGWAQVTRYVSTTGTNSNPASATSWATSTTNLQGTIDASASGERVFVARGLYKPGGNANTDRTISFSMKNGVVIYGGFVGNESEPDQRPAVNPIIGSPTGTTLSGEIGNLNSTADNSLHVIYNVTGLTNTAVLDGFVITGGNANIEEILSLGGGGVYNNGGFNNDNELSGNNCSPTFRNCLFQANSGLAGGAMLNDGQDGTSSPIIINCLFRANTTTRTGGAIVNDGSTDGISNPVLTNCVFQNNTAGLIGGAMFNTAEFNGISSPVLTNCSFVGNTSGDSGGAMFNEGKSGRSSPTLTNCAFLSNTANLGGALYNSGVDAGNSSPVLINCSFLSNTANEGGALYNDGSAAANRVSGTSNVQVANSIFWDNGGGANTFVNNNAALTATYSLFQPSVTGYGSSPTNLTATTSPFVSPTSVTLAVGSVAINAGNPASVTVANPPYSGTALPTTDLVGAPRILGGRVDMGAVEYPGPFSLSLLTAVTPNPVCRGNTVALSVTASGGNRPYSYTWTAPVGFTVSGTSTSAVSGTVGNAVSGVQTFTVRVADASPTPNVSTSVISLTVNTVPTATLVASTTLLTCQQTSLTLTASGGASYTLLGGPVSQTNSTGVFTVSRAATYTAIVATASGCVASTTATVVSNTATPTVSLNASTTLLTCTTTSATLTVSGDATTYRWTGGTSGTALTVNTAGTYSVTATGANGCTAISSLTIGQNLTLPAFSISSSTDCQRGVTSLTALGCTGNVAWPGGIVGPVFSTSLANVYTATCTVGICTTTASATVTSPPTVTLSATPSTTLTCEQISLTLTTSATGSGLNYAFSGPAGGIVSQNATSGTAVVSQPGTYTVVVTGSNGCTARSTTVISSNAVQVTRLYVSASQTAVNGGDGLSWQTAFKDLQRALSFPCSQSLTEIWVAVGTYKPTSSTTNRGASFAMRNNLSIIGGFVGNETTFSQRPALNPVSAGSGPGTPSSSTLSGDIDNDGTLAGNSIHIIFNPQGLNNTAVLDGFVITGGNADAERGFNALGGGIYNDNSSPTLLACSFLSNQANGNGGAIYNIDNSNPVLTNCSFQRNEALGQTGRGGAISNQNSSPTLTNCSFIGNRNTGQFGTGGAIFNVLNCRPVLTNCSFLANQMTGQFGVGGAICNDNNSTLTLTNCSFQNNQVVYQGAAIYNNDNSRLVLTNGVLWNNGGSNSVINSRGASLTATYSLFDAASFISDPTNRNTATSPFAGTATVALTVSSAAINMGNPNSVTVASPGTPAALYSATALPATDLAGNPRIVRERVDAGAVEFQGPFSLSLLTSAAPNPVCAGTSVGLSVTATGGTTGMPDRPYSYTWAAPAGISLSGTSTSAVSASVGAGVTGVQTLTITVADALPSAPVISSAVVSLTVNASPAPTLTPTPSATLTCAQTSLTLTAGGGVSYAFSGPSGGIVSQNAASGTAVINQPGTYTVTVTGTSSCTARSTIVISQSLVQVTRLYVAASQTATNGGDGLTWATAFKDLQQALTYPCSQSLTEIWVATGTYKPTSSITNRTASFSMRNDLAIIGGFAGSETSLTDRPRIDPVSGNPSSSTLSGDIDNNGTLAGNSIHVISNAQGLTNSAVLDGFVVTGGNADGTNFNGTGGGVYNNGIGTGQVCSPSFRNCAFIGNSAAGQFGLGGAMYNNGQSAGTSSPLLINCSLQNNSANRGGAIYNDGRSSPLLINCSLQNNSASRGGAVYNFGNASQSNPQLINCSLQNNSASIFGGAIYNDLNGGGSQASPVLTNSIFWNNGATPIINVNGASGTSATYSLFDNANDVNTSGPGNLIITTSPFVSASSIALNACSPAINAGNPASVTVANGPYSATALPATDLAANPRIFGVGPANRRIDMGAVEFQAPSGSFTATLTASPSGTLTCAQTSLTLTATVGAIPGASFTFSGPGLTQSGSSSTAVASQEGVYSVTVVNASGCSSVGSTTVSSSTAPPAPPTLSASASAVCVGANVVVVATVGATGISATFQWYQNSSPVAGQTSATLALGGVQQEQAGQYVLVLSGGCSATSTPFILTVNPLPTVTLGFPAGSTVVGPGTGVATITLPSPFTSTAMQAFGGVQFERLIVIDRINGYEIRQVDTNTTGIFNVNQPGPFRLTVTDGNGCQRTVEGTVVVRP